MPLALSRRAFVAGGMAFPLLASQARAAGTLRITAYDGFVPATFQRQFETETGTSVRLRLAASQAPELTLLTAERDAPITDLCTVAGARLHQFATNGIIEPIDTRRLKNWSKIDPRYADAPWNQIDGATMGVPLVLGTNVLVYDPREVTPAPDSWGALFDPRYKGRVTYDIEDVLLCTMLWQGADSTFVTYLGDPPAAKRAVDAARDQLIATKSQVVRYFDEGAELQQLLVGGDAILAQTYASTPSKLILAGQPFRRVIPKEGTPGYVYTFGMIKGAPNRDAAYAFLDAMLGAPGMEAALTRSAGYLSAFSDAGAGLTDVEQAAFGIPPEALGRVRFSRFEGQALGSKLIDRAVEEVKAA